MSPSLYESQFFIFRQYCNLVLRVKKIMQLMQLFKISTVKKELTQKEKANFHCGNNQTKIKVFLFFATLCHWVLGLRRLSSGTEWPVTQRYPSEERTLQPRRCENLRTLSKGTNFTQKNVNLRRSEINENSIRIYKNNPYQPYRKHPCL